MAYDSNVQYTPMIQVWMVYATHLWDVIEEKNGISCKDNSKNGVIKYTWVVKWVRMRIYQEG